MTEDNDVGYGKPPKKNQFKPGQSGNKKGRPKGTKNLKTDLQEELAEKIPIKEGGKQKKISKQRAMLKSLMAKAVQGDPRASNTLLSIMIKLLTDEETMAEDQELTATDKAVLDAFTQKIITTTKITETYDE
jgi:GMP synthase PP-ATPase subunit